MSAHSARCWAVGTSLKNVLKRVVLEHLETWLLRGLRTTPITMRDYGGDRCFCFKDFIYLFLEREGGREKERERNINTWLSLAMPPTGDLAHNATQACALTENRTGDPLVRRPALNPLSHTSQGVFAF